MPRRQNFNGLIAVAVFLFLAISLFLSLSGGAPTPEPRTKPIIQKPAAEPGSFSGAIEDSVLHGIATAPKLGNETLKAELGHATWRFLHTMVAKFPDEPTTEDSAALKSFMYLFARLYPCGECARHFQQILADFPPQVATRNTAAGWLCHVHNVVNESLKKPRFDCSKIGDFYDCGCADDAEKDGKTKTKSADGDKGLV